MSGNQNTNLRPDYRFKKQYIGAWEMLPLKEPILYLIPWWVKSGKIPTLIWAWVAFVPSRISPSWLVVTHSKKNGSYHHPSKGQQNSMRWKKRRTVCGSHWVYGIGDPPHHLPLKSFQQQNCLSSQCFVCISHHHHIFWQNATCIRERLELVKRS